MRPLRDKMLTTITRDVTQTDIPTQSPEHLFLRVHGMECDAAWATQIPSRPYWCARDACVFLLMAKRGYGDESTPFFWGFTLPWCLCANVCMGMCRTLVGGFNII